MPNLTHSPKMDSHSVSTLQGSGLGDTDEANKRKVVDTSFDTSPPPNKLSVNPAAAASVPHEQSLAKSMEAMFAVLHHKLDQSSASVDCKLGDIITRLSGIEEQASSRDIVIANLQEEIRELHSVNNTLIDRIRALEVAPSAGAAWEPSGTPDTNILLLGDSNYSGKIKFGGDRGTLGEALPGRGDYCAKFDHLPQAEDIPQDVSDIVLAVGTNHLKQIESSEHDPALLVKDTYKYVSSVLSERPAVRVLVPGVLPTRALVTNVRIMKYNHYLRDMCTRLPRAQFLETSHLADKRSGLLSDKFWDGADDGLHLNQTGIKIIGSKLKEALRAGLNLPHGSFRRGRPKLGGSRRGGDRGARNNTETGDSGGATSGGSTRGGLGPRSNRGRGERGGRRPG